VFRRFVVPCAVAAALTLGWGASSASALDVNVLNAPYSAAGNGTTNDRAAIQSAINAVNTAGGGTVTLPGTHTYLTGDLTLKTGVTLDIASGATVLQSQTIADYAHAPTKGRAIPGSTVPFITYLDQNYPLIYAGNASDVAITGAGTIQMTYNGTDANSIIVHAIGFNLVSDYAISGITIAGASAYNVAMRNTDHGEISGITTTTPNTLNSDGISLMNSSYISVHDNDLTTLDDGIYVWASYDDPRRSAWWDSDTPRPSHDIEVYDNVVDNQATNGSHGFLFINWTAAAPDQSLVEISRINVHDNVFSASYPVGALVQDIYHSQSQKTPSKWLRFVDNTLTVVAGSSGSASHNLNQMATTDFVGDDPAYDFALSSNTEGIYNSNFDGLNAYSSEQGLSFWSTEGSASAPSTSVGQPGGRYGQIDHFDSGYASVTQGVYLATGTYTFSAAVQSSGASIRMLAVQGSTVGIAASTSFTNTSWATQSISFTVTTAGNYRLGIDNAGAGGGSTAFGRIDNAVLTKTS
jgi:hypothetical protein